MLDLYVLENCPYCDKVINFMNEKHVQYNKIDISNPKCEEILIKLIYNSQDDIGKISTLRKQMYSSLSDKDIIELIFVEKSPIEREYILSLLNNELLKYIIQDFYSIPTIKKMCDEDGIKLHNLLLSPI